MKQLNGTKKIYLHKMQNKIKYPLSDSTWDENQIRSIESVVKSGMFTMGKKVQIFEFQFAEYFGAKFAVMVNSGSSANLISIASLFYSNRLTRGDEVIVPAVSWPTMYYPLHQFGLKIKFVDIDINTLNIDYSKIESAISQKTKALFVVNLLGNPNDFNKLTEICINKNLILIEDNCESLGAKYNNNYTGTFGIMGTFSTFFSHHICTMEGGIILTNEEDIYHYLLSLRAHGWTRNIPLNSKLHEKSSDKFYEYFNFILPGYNLRPLEIEAAAGICQINKISKIVSNRRANAKYFLEKISNFSCMATVTENGESSWFGFPIILQNSLMEKRDIIVKKLISEGIEVRPIVCGNFTRNKVINYMDYEIVGDLQNSNYIHDNGFFIGNHSVLIYDKIDMFFNLIKKIL